MFAAGEVCVNILDCFMSRTVLDDIWCLTFFCNAELFKKKKNIKLFQAVLNMQIAKLGNKVVLQNSTGPSFPVQCSSVATDAADVIPLKCS